jgi:serine/threonine protein kinase
MYIPFLPKYYLPLNLVDNSIDKNPLLMMDMLTHGNLADFMKKNRKSTSLNSKIVLMFSLTIALRLLDKYKIVHLDLKPNNIMMSSNLSIKIIDFGEAYH